MRLIAAFLFSAFLLIGTGIYVRFADNITPPPINLIEVEADDSYSIDITLTFDLNLDIFAGADAATLRVKLAGKPLFISTEPTIKAGTQIFLENVEGVKVGKNEFTVFASPGAAAVDSDLIGNARALRVRIFRGNDPVPVVEKTIWSDSESSFDEKEKRIELFVAKDGQIESHDH